MPRPKPEPEPRIDPRKVLQIATAALKWLAAVLLFLAAGLAVVFVLRLLEARATSKWPYAEATVTEAAATPAGRDAKGRYRVEVSYAYRLHGVDHVGTRIGLHDQGTRDQKAAEELVADLKPGRKVDAYYDPLDPASSVLVTGASAADYIAFWLPALFLKLGLLTIVARRLLRRRLAALPAKEEPPKKPAAKW